MIAIANEMEFNRATSHERFLAIRRIDIPGARSGDMAR